MRNRLERARRWLRVTMRAAALAFTAWHLFSCATTTPAEAGDDVVGDNFPEATR